MANLIKAYNKSMIVSQIICGEGENAKTPGIFQSGSAVYSTFCFVGVGCYPFLIWEIGGLHNHVILCIAIKKIWFKTDRNWMYPTIVEALKEAVLWTTEEYIYRQYNTIRNASQQEQYNISVQIKRGCKDNQSLCSFWIK